MRVRLGAWTPGDPPSLLLEAETQDDTVILAAFNKGRETHEIVISGTWACNPSGGRLAGQINLGFHWMKKKGAS